MFGLLGPNGAGKSTLMRTIATLQEADSGQIRLGDLDVLKNQPEVRKVLGYLPQEFGVYLKVSPRLMLDHIALLKGVTNKSERRELVDAMLNRVNLYQHRKKAIAGFSGGMKQRFGIAQALLGDPKLVIVDEPTAGLDPGERISENFDEPDELVERRRRRERNEKEKQNEKERSNIQGEERGKLKAYKNELTQKWLALDIEQREQIELAAIQRSTPSLKNYLQKRSTEGSPALEFVNELARLESLPTTIEFESNVLNEPKTSSTY